MPSVIVAKLDVTKVDKARLFAGKNGAKYLDIVLIPSANDRYGNDYMVTQSVSKEEREKGVKGAILGNAKILGGRSDNDRGQRAPSGANPGSAKPAAAQEPDEDVPF